ncbi:MAG: Methyltransferase type 11 [Actinomycetia bacterium]|nr:Methyltransferase type 11 [Actinomycetes bacterium]
MDRYAKETYGDRIAGVYDEYHARLNPADGVAFLADLAGAGRVLELGIGTGRVALPLAARGVKVDGIDASQRMVDQMRAKPGGNGIDVTIGDFSSFALDDRYALVYVVFNTFFALFDQDAQVLCFERVATHLEPGGRFVLECFVPDLARFDRGQSTTTTQLDVDDVRIDASLHDAAAQVVRSQHIIIRDGKLEMFPVALRYAWPSELDLMARLTGFEREARYAGWNREPFSSASVSHVTVYRKS